MVACNHCNRQFKMRVQTRRLKTGDVQHYFDCPKCRTRYTVATITPKGQTLQKKIATIFTAIRLATFPAVKAALISELGRLQQQMKAEVS